MNIIKLSLEGVILDTYPSLKEAARVNDLDISHINKVLKGKRKTHGGFLWRAEDLTTSSEKLRLDYAENSAILEGTTEKSITSKEEAISFFDVDLETWDVERYVVNSWDVTMKGPNGLPLKRTNYQVKLWLVKKRPSIEEVSKDILAELKDHVPRRVIEVDGRGTITVELADFHIGADIRNLARTPDFNTGVIVDYMSEIVSTVNGFGALNVVVNLHGDFVESVTGLNHDDSWKSMGKDLFGANVIILANEIIGGKLLSNIKNLSEVNIVSGNHDRISAKKSEDNLGEIAKLLAWTLKKDFPEIDINFDGIILVREIDGVNHIMTHGHLGISKKDLAKVIADYGRRDMFNLWTEGHKHSRDFKKVMKSKGSIRYETIEYVQLDEQNYRKLVLPPIFTGNFYSESLGFSGWAGFIITENNGRGIPNIYDYSI